MSGMCGWLGSRTDEAQSRELIDKMLQPLLRPNARPDRALLKQGAVAATGFGKEGSQLCRANGIAVALLGHIRLAGQPAATNEDVAREIARAYASEGERLLERLSGAFALAILDESSDAALLATDRMGVFPLLYTTRRGGLIFASSADALRRHPLANADLDSQSLFNYVYFHVVPGPDTAMAGQRRLLPGEYLRFKNGAATTQRYWRMRFDEDTRDSFEILKSEFIDTMRKAVGDAAQGARTGAFLSGGTDSSTVAGLLTQATGEPARTFSIGFEAAGYDEMSYARIAAKHFGTDHHEYYVTPDDIVSTVPRIAQLYDQPFGNSSAVPTYLCARLAKESGIERLLGGDGGDELFGGNVRYARQHVFELYNQVPGAIRSALVEPLTMSFPGGDRIPGLKKVRSYIRQANMPMPARLETYNLLDRFGAAHVFSPEFLRSVDVEAPGKQLDDEYRSARANSLINRMLALDFKITLADNDLPKVVRACELAGVDVAFPILDDRVVAFSARLAPELKLKGTQLRYFFKEALRGFLPDAIINKQKHGFGLPFGPWLASHRGLQELVHDCLSALKKRQIVRSAFLDELTDSRVAEHPGYYGTMVWVLMMLELWFEHHVDA
jgi:asparagine synthase (glutamine-hydrolysing)